MKNKYMICAAMILGGLTASAQNVGINVAGATPHASSILDLNTGNTFTSPNGKGMLIPNVALTGTGDATTVASPATSLMVYNTATAGSGATAVTPGYYYWDGTKWVQFQSSSNASQDWKLTGNSGTTAGTNFIGTTDAVDFVTKTNNAERMRVTSTGKVGIGTSAPLALLHMVGTNQVIQQIEGTASPNYSDIGIRMKTPDAQWDLTVNRYNPTGGGLLSIGSPNVGATTAGNLLNLTTSGKVGIGTQTPAAKLEVNNGTTAGAIKIVDGTQGAGKVLVSDANGVGQWKLPQGGYCLYKYAAADNLVVDRSSRSTLKWTTALADPNSLYNTSTGEFTAPVNGVYKFDIKLHLSCKSGWNVVILEVETSSGTRYRAYEGTQSPSVPVCQISGTQSIYLNAGEKAWVTFDAQNDFISGSFPLTASPWAYGGDPTGAPITAILSITY